MKKVLKLLTMIILSGATSINLVACGHNENSEFQFNLKNLLTSTNIQAQAIDSIGNVYFVSFDSENIGIPGVKIEKYDIKSKQISLAWHNPNWKTGIISMIIIDNNFYVGSVNGGSYILNNNDNVKQIPKVSGSVGYMYINKNDLYINTTKGLYEYNIIADNTQIITLPHNLRPFKIFIDSNDNMYICGYSNNNNKNYVYILQKDKAESKLITGDYFFNKNTVQQFIEINHKIYFCSVDYNNHKSCIYNSDLNPNKVNRLFELSTTNNQLFNIKDKVGLLTNENNNSIVKILINNNFEKKYEIKDKLYDLASKIGISFNQEMYLIRDGNNIDNLSWK